MTSVSDAALAHLREIADLPDLGGTHYELIETLGRGGMGAVYLVMDHELQRPVALKVLCDPDPDPDAVARLVAEARVIAQLEHPGIVPVHQVGTLPDGRAYYTMKRAAGTRLDAWIAEQPPLVKRLRIFERICEPVAFAHSRGVIHRDIKPENVMVGGFGEVLVMDWGLALRKGEPVPVRAIAGTPGYMAPEQRRDGIISERSDVYSLGVLLAFMLTGQPPKSDHDGSTGPERQGTASIKQPRPLVSICQKAMAEDPAERYPSVTALSADIARHLAKDRVLAHRETRAEWAARTLDRFRTPLALVLAYLVMRLILLLVRRS
jgi:eukaryotic-like serine/threonine-protein kinase